MRKILVVLALSLLFVSVAAMAQRPEDPISQGDFAVLLASSLNKPAPSGGWNKMSAPAYLSSMSISPSSGVWLPSATLNEGDFAYVLRLLGLNVYATQPDSQVTWGKARAMVGQYQDFFRKINLKGLASDATNTTHIDTGIGGDDAEAPAPASPVEP